ncbi:hypothetical protein CAter282_2906 [Collimonas arenae]|uniref:Uncharacterized protein n=1 Tax=Collimonas arenae TaxID=279058 RepID=A0A127PSP6_9BURK|nr:hypothetical protein CAter10_3198 [Collimonas arenae]AMP10630.1 hypothetical protein CAter282_2906 [Collimonas arenae]
MPGLRRTSSRSPQVSNPAASALIDLIENVFLAGDRARLHQWFTPFSRWCGTGGIFL